jgi:hypothetical protein
MRTFKYISPHISTPPHPAACFDPAAWSFLCDFPWVRQLTTYIPTHRFETVRHDFSDVITALQLHKIDRRVHPCLGHCLEASAPGRFYSWKHPQLQLLLSQRRSSDSSTGWAAGSPTWTDRAGSPPTWTPASRTAPPPRRRIAGRTRRGGLIRPGQPLAGSVAQTYRCRRA